MSFEVLVSTADLCQSATLFISFSAYLPQWKKLLETRSSKNISLNSWFLWLVSSVLSLFYALVQISVYGTGVVLAVTSIMTTAFLCFTIILVYRFRPETEEVPATLPLAQTSV